MKKLLVIGGGTAGITAASQLLRKTSEFEVTIIEPSDKHYYQPIWTLVGAGEFNLKDSVKLMADVIPSKAKWVKDFVTEIKPDTNSVVLKSGDTLTYDYLFVCPGIQINWNKIKGLEEAIGKDGVCSNYDSRYVEKSWEFMQKTKSGKALFTFPNTPIKCGGAPQKIMYLAEHYFRKAGVRDNVSVEFTSAGEKIFGVEKYRVALEKIVGKRNIETSFDINLEEIVADKKIAIYRNVKTGETVEKSYDFIHVVPPMSSPDFIKNSPISNSEGWVDVDQFTLQHKKFKNIFSLGDASSLPTAKTGAAIRKQVPVLVSNFLNFINNKAMSKKYNGYTSCPLVTSYSTVIMAEFDYDGNPMETFPFDQSKERYSMYLLKKYGIPFIYWNGMLRGYTG